VRISAVALRKGELDMAKYNEHVKIDGHALIADGVNNGMMKAAAKDDRIIAILEDMGFPGVGWFKENAPHRAIECGIAEANAAVVAAGLAAEGYVPFIHSFAFAAVSRACNQIRQSILQDRFNVKILGREGAWGEPGISHNHIEIIGITRVMPNMVIVDPADIIEAEKAVMAIADYYGPAFLKIEASPPPLKIFTADYPFDLGKAYMVKDGKDATIIACGYMLTEAILAGEFLEKEGIDVRIINMSTIKPLDNEAVIKASQETGAIVTAENASIIGGLGEAVATALAEYAPAPLVRVGIEDEFSQSGRILPEIDELKTHFGLGAEDVALSVKECIAKREAFKKRK
jgi:transketolase